MPGPYPTPEQLAANWRRSGWQMRPQRPLNTPPETGQVAPAGQVTQAGPAEAPVQVQPAETLGPTGFVSFGAQLAANQGTANAMAGQAANAALGGGGVGNLGNDAGRQALLQKAYGKAAQVTGMDAAMAGAAGGDYYRDLEATYGPEAQARAAAQRAQQAKDNAAQQASMAQQGAALQKAQANRQAGPGSSLSAQAQAIRQSDANRPRGQVTQEQWANMHGMTLEQWLQNGKNPKY